MGRLDSGAEEIFLRQTTCHNLKVPFSTSSLNTIEFGNGSSVNTSLAAQLNASLSALVLPDQHLVEDLISTHPITKLGYDILLSDDGGWILKGDSIKPPESSKVVPITRQDRKWQVNIDHLRCLSARSDVFPEVMMLHRLMGHASPYQMVQAINFGIWVTDLTSDQVTEAMRRKPCPACALGKKNHTPIPRSRTDPKSVPIGHFISGDIIGPIKPETRTGHRYFFLFVDRRTSFMHVFTSKTKDGFITSLKEVYNFYMLKGITIHVFKSDSESIMVQGNVAEFIECKGIDHQTSLPYEHYQNLVERHVQTLVKMVATNLHDQSFLNATFWDYALFYCVHVWNFTPNTKTDGSSPTRLIDNTTPPIQIKRDISFPFGTPVMPRIVEPAWRFDSRRDMGIFLGPVKGTSGGGLIYLPSTGAIVARGDLIGINVTPQEFERYSNIRTTVSDTRPIDLNTLTFDIPNTNEQSVDAAPTSITPLSRRKVKECVRRILTRSQSKLGSKLSALLVRKANELEEALGGSEGPQWTIALNDEVESLFTTTETIEQEIPNPNVPYDIIYVTVVLKKKMKDEVTVDKYKVRICACGNQLISKADYGNETYSPTVSPLVHSLLLQLSITDMMFTATFDTISAYLHQHYPQDIKPLYLKFPKALAEASGRDPNALYRIKKYLYGLPDAGRAYYLALSQHLKDHGYKQSQSDNCLFYNIDTEKGIRTLIWFHVDDLFASSTKEEELLKLNEVLSIRFPVKFNRNIDAHLGITMTKDPINQSILLTQPKLLNEILQYIPEDTLPAKYPATIRRSNDSHQSPEISSTEYLGLLGKLLHLVHSRPDISTAVSYAATKAKSPTQWDYDNRLLNIVSFLKGTQSEGLRLYPSSDNSKKLRIVAYCDAAYMSHPDASSHTGYIIGLCTEGSTPKSYFHSKSQKQKLIATSSTHAEIRALYQLVITLIYIYNLLKEIKRDVEVPIIIYEDNKAAIDLTQGTNASIGKSKHYLMLTRFIQQQIQTGLAQLSKIPSEKNLANVLTKIVASPEFISSFNQITGAYPAAVETNGTSSNDGYTAVIE